MVEKKRWGVGGEGETWEEGWGFESADGDEGWGFRARRGMGDEGERRERYWERGGGLGK